MNIRTLCLGILSFREATGYEIKKMVEDGMFSHFIDASYGSIYPALTQMLNEGLLTVRAEEQSGKPDKKVYAITARRAAPALAEAVDVFPRPDKFKSEFLFQMLLMDQLSGEKLAAISSMDASMISARNWHVFKLVIRLNRRKSAGGSSMVMGRQCLPRQLSI